MLGSKQLMPKRLRYPLFLVGLVVILVGGLAASSSGASESSIVAIVLIGFAVLMSSVIFK